MVVQCETAEAAGEERPQECACCADGMRLLVPGSESGKAEAVTAEVGGFELCATALTEILGGWPSEFLA